MFCVVDQIRPVKGLSEEWMLFGYSCTCRDPNNGGAFRANANPEIRTFVQKWCEDNLNHSFLITDYETVLFSNEDDAVLFYMTFR